MNYNERFSKVTVLGAAGKMGSGILLLLAHEMFDLNQKYFSGKKEFVLNALDLSEESLQGLLKYVEKQTRKKAERKPEAIKGYFQKENIPEDQMITKYVEAVLSQIHPTTNLQESCTSNIIFEAASENKDLKVKLLREIDQNASTKPWFFTNTSSIPIHELDEEAGLDGRILGFHFYNPPAVQKLVELIVSKQTLPELKALAEQLAERLRKIIVPSNDKAGFIGNGHFMRDALFGLSEVERLQEEMSFVEAVYTINYVSQYFLVRPMGIFQLCDYVGLDVVQFIMKVMNPYFSNESLHSDLLDTLLAKNVKGGQRSDGSQKDGFLRYIEGQITGVYDLGKGTYVDVKTIEKKVIENLGPLPENYKSWKDLLRDPDRSSFLDAYFTNLRKTETKGADLSVKYGIQSKKIGLQLVQDQVAFSENDVNKVLLTGFYHLYGPINPYFD